MVTEQNYAMAVVRQLAAWGVKRIFGVAGDDVLPLLDALAQDNQIMYIGTAHEAGAAFMATYHAKLTGELGVCLASAAGTINMLEGLADAYLDSAPVLALTGQLSTSQMGTLAKQYLPQQKIIGNLTIYSELITSAQAGVRLLIRAMSQAILRHSVAHLSIPVDVWSHPVQAEPGPRPALTLHSHDKLQLAGDLDRASRLLLAARRPLLLAGNRSHLAIAEFQELAATWGAAIVVSLLAKGVIPDNNPHVISGVGEAWLPAAINECDCVLLIGSASYEEQYLPRVPIIQIEAWPWLINDLYLWDSLAGNLPTILTSLNQRIMNYRKNPVWNETIARTKQDLAGVIAADIMEQSNPIHPAHLMATLNQVIAQDAIIALDAGAYLQWFIRNFQASSQKLLISSYWRSMGYGLPAALAAQLLFPERQVVALVGEGGLLMVLGELTTAIKYRLPVKILVVNNGIFGLEKDKADAAGLASLGLDVQAPDFSQYGRACGMQAFQVTTADNLLDTLHQAMALQEAVMVEVLCRDVRLPALLSR